MKSTIERICTAVLAEIEASPAHRIGSNEKAAAKAAVITVRERLLEPGVVVEGFRFGPSYEVRRDGSITESDCACSLGPVTEHAPLCPAGWRWTP